MEKMGGREYGSLHTVSNTHVQLMKILVLLDRSDCNSNITVFGLFIFVSCQRWFLELLVAKAKPFFVVGVAISRSNDWKLKAAIIGLARTGEITASDEHPPSLH